MKFGDLRTGDVMGLGRLRAVVMGIERPHPLNPAFLMVVFYIFAEKRLSFDMLHPDYELIPGTTVHQDGMASFREALEEVQ